MARKRKTKRRTTTKRRCLKWGRSGKRKVCRLWSGSAKRKGKKKKGQSRRSARRRGQDYSTPKETSLMGRSFWTRRNPDTGRDEFAMSQSGPWEVQTDAAISRLVDEIFS